MLARVHHYTSPPGFIIILLNRYHMEMRSTTNVAFTGERSLQSKLSQGSSFAYAISISIRLQQLWYIVIRNLAIECWYLPFFTQKHATLSSQTLLSPSQPIPASVTSICHIFNLVSSGFTNRHQISPSELKNRSSIARRSCLLQVFHSRSPYHKVTVPFSMPVFV